MFQGVLNTISFFGKLSYTLWNVSLILSHPPSLFGQCPKFDRTFFCTASLTKCECKLEILILGLMWFIRKGRHCNVFQQNDLVKHSIDQPWASIWVLYIHEGADTEAEINFHRTIPSKVCAPWFLIKKQARKIEQELRSPLWYAPVIFMKNMMKRKCSTS